VLEKGGADNLNRSCDKWGSITWSQGRQEYSTQDKNEGS